MNRGFKVLTTVLIVVIGGLAVVSGFLYAKTTVLEKQINGDDVAPIEVSTIKDDNPIQTDLVTKTDENSTADSPATLPTTTVTTTPTPKPTTTTTTAPKSGTAGTYTVTAGDTMYSIGLELDVNWLDLAKANGLDETTANKIKVGQVLVLPK
jgi:LysM repeat protein